MKDGAEKLIRRAENLTPYLAGLWQAASQDGDDGDAAVVQAASDLLQSFVEFVHEPPEAPAPAAPPAEAKVKPEGHRHKYGADGRCTLSLPGGSGMCTAMSREAKKAATATPPAPPAGGSTP